MMANQRIRAAFYRGGTSNAVVFDGRGLPADRTLRDRIFLYVLGSPDPYGRQLDGMGGGISSLSKVVIVEPSVRDDADVDYTFVQIAVRAPVADYNSTCGNMSSSVGPFAVDLGMIDTSGDRAKVRIYNTNTGQIYHSEFSVEDGKAVEEGDFEIPGVAGTGAKIKLDFLDPGGAGTGSLLPTGNPVDRLTVEGVGDIDVSMVDAANPVAFVNAGDFGHSATEMPDILENDSVLMRNLDAVRRTAAVAMGMADSVEGVALSNPKIAMVAPAQAFIGLDGRSYLSDDNDICVRLISMGNFHRAITLTGGMCVAAAAQISGTLVANAATPSEVLRIGNASGVLPVLADVQKTEGQTKVISTTTFRTQRCIMEGYLLYPVKLLAQETAEDSGDLVNEHSYTFTGNTESQNEDRFNNQGPT